MSASSLSWQPVSPKCHELPLPFLFITPSPITAAKAIGRSSHISHLDWAQPSDSSLGCQWLHLYIIYSPPNRVTFLKYEFLVLTTCPGHRTI